MGVTMELLFLINVLLVVVQLWLLWGLVSRCHRANRDLEFIREFERDLISVLAKSKRNKF